MSRPALLVALMLGAVASSAQSVRPSPTPARAKDKEKSSPRVFTNDDLEAARKKPSNVQDLSATAGTTDSGYAGGSAALPEVPVAQPTPSPPSAEDEFRGQIAAIEERIKSLDERAKQILWQYLQSTDTNEILSLKAEQKQILDEIESAKAELALLHGRQPSGTPVPEPTRAPG